MSTTQSFITEHKVSATKEELFRFFEVPENLSKISPPEMGLTVVKVEGDPLRAGSKITYKFKQWGIPMKWVARIAEWKEGEYFIDEQLSGPFSYYQHCHRIITNGNETLIRDEIEYKLPFGLLGNWFAGKQVKSLFLKAFEFRKEAMLKNFPNHTY
ncbi:MAG: hypothetical protein EBS07_08905 [Sphingobacteriia bacterium]|nr:hypothetical protein [Sphingobacteriia bacterium]